MLLRFCDKYKKRKLTSEYHLIVGTKSRSVSQYFVISSSPKIKQLWMMEIVACATLHLES